MISENKKCSFNSKFNWKERWTLIQKWHCYAQTILYLYHKILLFKCKLRQILQPRVLTDVNQFLNIYPLSDQLNIFYLCCSFNPPLQSAQPSQLQQKNVCSKSVCDQRHFMCLEKLQGTWVKQVKLRMLDPSNIHHIRSCWSAGENQNLFLPNCGLI